MTTQILPGPHNTRLSARIHEPLEPAGPRVMFVHGYGSDKEGSKAMHLYEMCRAHDLPYLAIDCRGHGQSSGVFEHMTLSDWREDCAAALDAVPSYPTLVVGSSLGGWLMLLLALDRPAVVQALIGVAAAPDFTVRLLDDYLTAENRDTYENTGRLVIPAPEGDPYVFTKRLIEDSNTHKLLDGNIPFAGPVVLLQGEEDQEVPLSTPRRLAAALTSQHVEIWQLKGVGHRQSEPQDLRRLETAVQYVCRAMGAGHA